MILSNNLKAKSDQRLCCYRTQKTDFLTSGRICTVQFLYNTPLYNIDLDITLSFCGSKNFKHGNLQRNYKKMTIIKHDSLRIQSISINLKLIVIKGLNCKCLFVLDCISHNGGSRISRGGGGTSKPFVKRILTLFLFFSPQLIYSVDPISYFRGEGGGEEL